MFQILLVKKKKKSCREIKINLYEFLNYSLQLSNFCLSLLEGSAQNFGCCQMTTSQNYVGILQQPVYSQLSCLLSFAYASHYAFLFFRELLFKELHSTVVHSCPGLCGSLTQTRGNSENNKKTAREGISIFWCLARLLESTLHFPSQQGA